jgi:hypothetical protein
VIPKSIPRKLGVTSSSASHERMRARAGVVRMFSWFRRKPKPEPILTSESVRPLVDRAVAELQARTAAIDGMIRFTECDWSVDQDEGLIRFARTDGSLEASAPVQIIGSYNTADGTWLWAWDNPSTDDALRTDSIALREYGRKHKIEALTTPKLECEESDCWELAALACMLGKQQGAYRGPAGATFVFMTFGKVTMSKAKS